MFLDFYGLSEQPFGTTADPRYLYLSPTHREVLASLIYGIEEGLGFSALIAKPGMGKTTLLVHLLGKFRSSRTALLFQTQCTSSEFIRLLLNDLGCDGRGEDTVLMHEEFNKLLVDEARAGRRVIVVIDEAQNLEPSVLETVRLLSNFETPKAKLVQIVIAGQPELAEKLAHSSLSQLRQRISILTRLAPLSLHEIERYIAHRLQVAGYKGDRLFTPQAQKMIADLSEGIPRNINKLCFNVLSLGCALSQKTIEADVVAEVAKDFDLSEVSGDSRVEPSQPLPAAEVVRSVPKLICEMHDPIIMDGKILNRPVGIEVESPVCWSPRTSESLTVAQARAYVHAVVELIRRSRFRDATRPS